MKDISTYNENVQCINISDINSVALFKYKIEKHHNEFFRKFIDLNKNIKFPIFMEGNNCDIPLKILVA